MNTNFSPIGKSIMNSETMAVARRGKINGNRRRDQSPDK